MVNQKPDIWTQLGFYAVIYVILLIVALLVLPFAKVIAPFAGQIIPINPDASVAKNVFAITMLYWGMVTVYMFLFQKKS